VRVAVLGVGLIGGSIGLAARARAGASVSGYDPDPAACAAALELGALDERAPDLAGAVDGAQVVFAAAPVGVLAATVREALAHVGPDCVVSDVGSTKLALADARADPRFVGGHPLAGAETAGVAHAREDLFEGATWYLTPGPRVQRAPYERLRGLIERLGARPAEIEPDAHDRLMACVSHLPHVLANVLVTQALAAFERERLAPAAGPSLRDVARVAGANTAIWTDIYLSNRDALEEALAQATRGLEEVRAALARADAAELAAWNERARAARALLLAETGTDQGDTRYRNRETLADARIPGSASIPEAASAEGARPPASASDAPAGAGP
jgi:prephenate dehydrogenase